MTLGFCAVLVDGDPLVKVHVRALLLVDLSSNWTVPLLHSAVGLAIKEALIGPVQLARHALVSRCALMFVTESADHLFDPFTEGAIMNGAPIVS